MSTLGVRLRYLTCLALPRRQIYGYTTACVLNTALIKSLKPSDSLLMRQCLEPFALLIFGQSLNADKPPSGLGIPMPYYPPELCFGYAPSRATDVWALACCIFEVQTQRLLVSPVFDSFEFLLGTLRYTLGPLPLEWKTRYSDDCASADFKGQGPLPNWFDEPEYLEWPLASLVDEGASHLSPTGKDQLLSLLRAMLEYEPSQRIQAEYVLNHLWIRETATDGASSMPVTG